ncbi:YrrS family protein [Bacillus sp. FJAT-29790]|nr:YrrS family protein [Bacillus sp. FJAT-29790]
MREKRRKTNFILNMLIGVVILLIIFVSATIFLGGNSEEAGEQKDKPIESKQNDKESNNKNIDTNKNNETAKSKEDQKTDEKQPANQEKSEQPNEAEDIDHGKPDELPINEGEAIVTAGGSSSNVKKTIENPSWKPIGTTQTGEHSSNYDLDSADWAEMLQAISYATGVDQGNMTVWFLGNNGPNRSVGTIVSKDQKEKYRVYIDWVDGQGWKPSKVEELNELK